VAELELVHDELLLNDAVYELYLGVDSEIEKEVAILFSKWELFIQVRVVDLMVSRFVLGSLN
jgi:hypothetical protein